MQRWSLPAAAVTAGAGCARGAQSHSTPEVYNPNTDGGRFSAPSPSHTLIIRDLCGTKPFSRYFSFDDPVLQFVEANWSTSPATRISWEQTGTSADKSRSEAVMYALRSGQFLTSHLCNQANRSSGRTGMATVAFILRHPPCPGRTGLSRADLCPVKHHAVFLYLWATGIRQFVSA
jgi:hypothetical protein